LAGAAHATKEPAPASPPTARTTLVYVSPETPGLRRRRSGRGFRYLDAEGGAVRDPDTLERIRKLAIPPAWEAVWICPDPAGHLQAVGTDAKGRRQYLYHPGFRALREAAKYEHMVAFAEALPALRARIDADMARPGMGRERVLATVAHLLETTMIRVGNAAYEKANQSFGLTTLRTRHVDVEGERLRFHFKGKSGKVWNLDVRDRRVARIVRQIQDLPGQHLFQYRDHEGTLHSVTSADVNAYLKDATGRDITAKDFRTWFGTVLAAVALAEAGPAASPTAAKTAVTRAIRRVADRLGNTLAICRKCYVHPEVIAAYQEGSLAPELAAHDGAMAAAERAVLDLLRARTPPAPPVALKD
jgi:DNA topoisomerase-1